MNYEAMEYLAAIGVIILIPLLIVSGISWLMDTFPSISNWFTDKANKWF